MANNTGTFFNINDNDGIPLVGVSTDGKVMINHLYGNCLIGSTSVTGTAGTGTIKITEYVESTGLLNPGKVVGEFSGTLKNINTNEMITISNGKFTAVKYL